MPSLWPSNGERLEEGRACELKFFPGRKTIQMIRECYQMHAAWWRDSGGGPVRFHCWLDSQGCFESSYQTKLFSVHANLLSITLRRTPFKHSRNDLLSKDFPEPLGLLSTLDGS
jgi:hypothetical protein